jgi:hypothetical protein
VTAPDPSDGFQRHELGFFVPSLPEPTGPDLSHVRTYLTYAELTRTASLPASNLIERLQKLSAADCLASLAHITTRLFAARSSREAADIQVRLVNEVFAADGLGPVLTKALEDGRWGAVFSEQQVVHLARLVIQHADTRPHDDFAGHSFSNEWVTCLVAVNDLLDADLEIEDADQRLAWEIRQCELNHTEDQLPVTALHHEIYSVLWPELDDQKSREVDEAFQRKVGMSIADYFTVGMSVMARFINRGTREDSMPGIYPSTFFSSARMQEETWRAFFDLNARDLGEMRRELEAEDEQYGPTTYGSLTFERYPLIEIEPGLYLPLSMGSLQRRTAEGVFHILSDAAAEEGLDRRHYSSAFGPVFQASVEGTIRRGVEASDSEVEITADEEYGGRSRRRRSSDVIVGYDRNPLFVEVVSGPLQAATVTRGDLVTFSADADRLVVNKAKQLDQNIRDYLAGELVLPNSDPALVSHAWPVIVTSHSFPHADYVTNYVLARVREEGYLQGDKVGDLAVVSAEELFFCEGFMQSGRSLVSLIRGWKSGPTRNLPFKNYLIALGGGRAPGSEHFERRFAEANADFMARMLGSNVTADDVLNHARDDAPGEDS